MTIDVTNVHPDNAATVFVRMFHAISPTECKDRGGLPLGITAGHAIDAIWSDLCSVLADANANRANPDAFDLFGTPAAAERLVVSLSGRIDAMRSAYIAATDIHGGKPDREAFAAWASDVRTVVAFIVNQCHNEAVSAAERRRQERYARAYAADVKAGRIRSKSEYAVSRIDEHGDAMDWDHYDSRYAAMAAAEALENDSVAVVVERVDANANRTTLRTLGNDAALRAGGWID